MNNNPVSAIDPTGGCETGNCPPEVGTVSNGWMWDGTDWLSIYGETITGAPDDPVMENFFDVAGKADVVSNSVLAIAVCKNYV
jgi:hypothetical protein